jgi:3-phenylpropionate/trans-cinnamate dioxygenase ferredoxin reductase component
MERVLIVGASLAGARSAEVLRDRGYTGALTLIGAEPHLPYDRPPLSKGVLKGGETPYFGQDWQALNVDLHLGERAIGMTKTHLTTTAGEYPFDGLILATGSAAIAFPKSEGLAGVHTLRTIDDAFAVRDALREGARVVIIGAGWIGAEVATTAALAGASVTVIEAAGAPLATALGEEIGSTTSSWYQALGIALMTSTMVAKIEEGPIVHLENGMQIPADLVVVGIGSRPDVGWLADSAVETDRRGVLVDEHLRSNLPQVFAVGDCANYPSLRFGKRITIAHREDAFASAETAASNLLGADVIHDPVPYVWSEQFGHMIQYAGSHNAGDDVLWRGDPSSASWACCWLDGDHLSGILTVDRPKDLARSRALISGRQRIDRALLADPEVPLPKCVLPDPPLPEPTEESA